MVFEGFTIQGRKAMYTLTKITQLSLVATWLVLAGVRVSARGHEKTSDFTIGKMGEVHFSVPVRAGNAVLNPGGYQVEHVLEGSDDIVSVNEHVVIFKKIGMSTNSKHGKTSAARVPAVHVRCKLEVVATKVRNTTIVLRTNASGEQEIMELQIAGEAFKHQF